MFSSFSSQDYNSLIQYEYEWWCKETGQTLSLPYPFSDEPFVEKAAASIIDYNLNKPLQKLSISSEFVEAQIINDVSSDEIFQYLKSYLAHVKSEDQTGRGNSFKHNHFIDICNIALKLKDRYSVYGFACILYLSKYFDWNGINFNQDFVIYIAQIFHINIKLLDGKPYNFSKSKEKAYNMIVKKQVSDLLLDKKAKEELKNTIK